MQGDERRMCPRCPDCSTTPGWNVRTAIAEDIKEPIVMSPSENKYGEMVLKRVLRHACTLAEQ